MFKEMPVIAVVNGYSIREGATISRASQASYKAPISDGQLLLVKAIVQRFKLSVALPNSRGDMCDLLAQAHQDMFDGNLPPRSLKERGKSLITKDGNVVWLADTTEEFKYTEEAFDKEYGEKYRGKEDWDEESLNGTKLVDKKDFSFTNLQYTLYQITIATAASIVEDYKCSFTITDFRSTEEKLRILQTAIENGEVQKREKPCKVTMVDNTIKATNIVLPPEPPKEPKKKEEAKNTTDKISIEVTKEMAELIQQVTEDELRKYIQERNNKPTKEAPSVLDLLIEKVETNTEEKNMLKELCEENGVEYTEAPETTKDKKEVFITQAKIVGKQKIIEIRFSTEEIYNMEFARTKNLFECVKESVELALTKHPLSYIHLHSSATPCIDKIRDTFGIDTDVIVLSEQKNKGFS